MKTPKSPIAVGVAALAAALLSLSAALPASARDSYVMDGGNLFSDATLSSLNQQIGDFAQSAGKEVVVDTVPSLNGKTIQEAAEQAFAQLQVNGVLIFMSKAEREDLVVGNRASRAFFPSGAFASVHDAMRGYFRSGDYDGGIKTGVTLVINEYRSHARSSAGGAAPAYPISKSAPSTVTQSTGGFHMSFFWLLIILLAGFLIIRAFFRAMSGPRMMPPGAGGPGYGPGPGYGGGYGYGGGGGGGSFFSGLLGGLGGAWLGNEMFGNRGGTTITQDPNVAGVAGGGAGDASGWQSDAGQADMGNAGGGDWGAGGGFDAGGGGGFDSGGGGGFDAGGGGDSGGGW